MSAGVTEGTAQVPDLMGETGSTQHPKDGANEMEHQKETRWTRDAGQESGGGRAGAGGTVNPVREGLSQRADASRGNLTPSPPGRATEAAGTAGLAWRTPGTAKRVWQGEGTGACCLPAACPHCSVHSASSCGHLPTSPLGVTAPLQVHAARTGARGEGVSAVRAQLKVPVGASAVSQEVKAGQTVCLGS